MTTQELFFETYAKNVQESVIGTGIFASVKLAQMAVETGYGKSIKKAANNCYGIKAGKSWAGKCISNTTFEVINGVRIKYVGTGIIYNSYPEAIKAGANYVTLFRVYNSITDSIKDHSQLLLRDRFAPVKSAKTPEEQCVQLKKCGYATGIDYDKVLIWIINKFGLKKYD